MASTGDEIPTLFQTEIVEDSCHTTGPRPALVNDLSINVEFPGNFCNPANNALSC
jgi:hypothetical protein